MHARCAVRSCGFDDLQLDILVGYERGSVNNTSWCHEAATYLKRGCVLTPLSSGFMHLYWYTCLKATNKGALIGINHLAQPGPFNKQ